MKRALATLTTLLLASSLQAADVDVVEPYARATAPGQMNSAAFMQLTNKGDATRLTGASSSAAEVVELHTHQHDQGVMRMRQVEAIDLPANETTTLAPGGLHIMLIGLPQPLAAGSSIELNLEFEDGDTRTLQVPVQMVMPGGMKHGNKSHGMHN